VPQEHEEDWHPSEGFWQEFFLLKPDAANLRRIIAMLSADDLLHLQARRMRIMYCADSDFAPRHTRKTFSFALSNA